MRTQFITMYSRLKYSTQFVSMKYQSNFGATVTITTVMIALLFIFHPLLNAARQAIGILSSGKAIGISQQAPGRHCFRAARQANSMTATSSKIVLRSIDGNQGKSILVAAIRIDICHIHSTCHVSNGDAHTLEHFEGEYD